jgi:hypothetical protein
MKERGRESGEEKNGGIVRRKEFTLFLSVVFIG